MPHWVHGCHSPFDAHSERCVQTLSVACFQSNVSKGVVKMTLARQRNNSSSSSLRPKKQPFRTIRRRDQLRRSPQRRGGGWRDLSTEEEGDVSRGASLPRELSIARVLKAQFTLLYAIFERVVKGDVKWQNKILNPQVSGDRDNVFARMHARTVQRTIRKARAATFARTRAAPHVSRGFLFLIKILELRIHLILDQRPSYVDIRSANKSQQSL